MGLKENFDWSAPPLKKIKKVKVPTLVASSYSSSRDTDENEDLNDTAAGPTSTDDPTTLALLHQLDILLGRYSSFSIVLVI